MTRNHFEWPCVQTTLAKLASTSSTSYANRGSVCRFAICTHVGVCTLSKYTLIIITVHWLHSTIMRSPIKPLQCIVGLLTQGLNKVRWFCIYALAKRYIHIYTASGSPFIHSSWGTLYDSRVSYPKNVLKHYPSPLQKKRYFRGL